MKSKIYSVSSKPLAGIALALALTSPLSALAGVTPTKRVNQYSSTQTVTEYAGWEDPSMRDMAASSGRALLAHLQGVKADLAADTLDRARSDLQVTQEFAQALERIMPYAVVVDDIRDAKNKLIAEDVEHFYEDLLPIYASLDEIQLYAPDVADNARSKVKQAEKKARKDDAKAAAEVLDEVADDIAATTIYLPVDYVDAQIRAALNALNKKPVDIVTARKDVDNALNSLQAQTVSAVVTP